MKEHLESFIRTQIDSPNEDELKSILDAFESRSFLKDDYFKKTNTVSKKLGFICTGSISTILTKEDGSQITSYIITSHNFLIDIFSFRTEVASGLAFRFLEDASMLELSLSKMDILLENNCTFNTLLRKYLVEVIISLSERYMLFLTGTAKDRYDFLIKNNPEFLEKYSLKMIASIIGITPTQLSRIRKQK